MSQQQGDDVHVCMDSRQAAVLARSVAHAARVAGAELALRANTSGLLIHGVSKAKTACLDVRFSPRFFEYFHVTGEDADATTGNDDNVDFAVYTKVRHEYHRHVEMRSMCDIYVCVLLTGGFVRRKS